MKELLEIVIKGLVDTPEQVTINEIPEEKETVYEIKVAETDMGKIIGKQGRIAKSIRTVMKAIASKDKKRIVIKFVE